jgi:ribosome biogenesis GTPase
MYLISHCSQKIIDFRLLESKKGYMSPNVYDPLSPYRNYLVEIGWSQDFESEFMPLLQAKPDLMPGRIVGDRRIIGADSQEYIAELPGKLRHGSKSPLDLPSVGDWVAIFPRTTDKRAMIEKVLNRKSFLVRRAPGEREEAQVIAANVNTAFITTSVNQDFNVRRLERYLSLVRSGGCLPVILLTKTDLLINGAFETDLTEGLEAIKKSAGEAPILEISSVTGTGFDLLTDYIRPGQTIAVIGSSGVGKSTLINRILGRNEMKTQDIRHGDDKGRHTTTSRYLLPLPQGGMIIDTPGMREIQLWSAESGIEKTFEDIEEIALKCKFTNCRHLEEKGCAVREAVKTGIIDPERLENFRKLAPVVRRY